VLVFGPGKLEHAHAADEHVEVSDVLDAAAVLATFAASV
jgi:acetylornithine deacetylase/succinyl-diaminopimelate desuccinylase-like protein